MARDPDSRDEIATAALEIVDREGVDALTMRRLAREVGLPTMTLYGRFSGKEEILEAVIDAASAPVSVELEGTWQERLRELALRVRQALNEHPALVQLRLRHPVVRPEALRFGEVGMSILRDAGLGQRDAAACFRLLFTYVFGFAALSPSPTAATQREQTDAAIAELESGAFPELDRSRSEFVAAVAGAEVFERGLSVLIAGIQCRTTDRHGP